MGAQHASPGYVALLRAVNVGGRNRLPMPELREALEARGLDSVSTLLQSGNVLFDAAGSEAAVAATIRSTVAEAFGLDIGVVVRTAAELVAIARANPFLAQREPRDAATLHVAFLDREPSAAAAALDPGRSPPDAFAVSGREVYLSYPNGSGRSRLTLDYLERTLGVEATARNWRTVQRLADLLRDDSVLAR
jgi:uncharacterized protein (DUF1697 family)